MPLRQRTYQILQVARPGDRTSRAFDLALITLVTVNVVAVILETVQPIHDRWLGAFTWLERVSVTLFAAEYALRIWTAPEHPRHADGWRGRLRWMRSPMAIIDLVAILPFFLPFVGVDLRFARMLRLVRLLRIAKLGRYITALQLFGDVARAKREELVLTSCVLGFLLLASSSLMYFAEHGAQPDKFSSIPETMWWAVATLTTVGYGDVFPITPVGRLLGAVVAIVGIGLFALPTAILGSGFIEAIDRRRSVAVCPHCGKALDEDPDAAPAPAPLPG